MASTQGHWKLYSPTWSRLVNWLSPFVEKGKLYLPEAEDGNKLTLEIQGVTAETIRELAGMRFILRGLFYRDGVLSICCYPQTDIEVYKLQKLSGKPITMLYCKLLEAKRFDTADVSAMESGVVKWTEAVFGELWPYQWSFQGNIYWTPMKIAHRALTNGPDSTIENNMDTILDRCSKGLYSEIDIWYENNKWYLGHDKPEKEVNFYYIQSPYLFIHAKHAEAFYKLQHLSDSLGLGLRIFYHTDEHYALTTKGETIILPGLPEKQGWLYMMPERTDKVLSSCGMICSDYA